MTLVPVNAG